MSKLTQYVAFMNSKELPTYFERINKYSDIRITKEMVKSRTEYQKSLKNNKQ